MKRIETLNDPSAMEAKKRITADLTVGEMEAMNKQGIYIEFGDGLVQTFVQE